MPRPSSLAKLQETEARLRADLDQTRKALAVIQHKRRAEAHQRRQKEEQRLGKIAYECGLQVFDSNTLYDLFMRCASRESVSGVAGGLPTFLEGETR